MKKKSPNIPVGARVKALKTIIFIGDSPHIEGEIYTVTEETYSYFNHNYKDYEIIPS